MIVDEAEAAHRIVSRAKYAAALQDLTVGPKFRVFLAHRLSSSRSDCDSASG